MGRVYDGIDAGLREFIEAQRMFFVATAPLHAGGHVNISPKGLDTFRILGPDRVAYLDYVGSGAETIAHVRENRRIALMWCAFEGPPRIVRLHGRGEILEPETAGYQQLLSLFPASRAPRAIIAVTVNRVSQSCGFGVPLYEFQGERSQLDDWARRKSPDALQDYQLDKNARSIDDLPAVTWLPRGNAPARTS